MSDNMDGDDFDTMPSGKKKKLKKLLAAGKGSKEQLKMMFGPNATIEMSVHPDRYFKSQKSHLKPRDVQNLIFWALLQYEVVNPAWCTIGRKPLLESVVLLHIPGLGERDFNMDSIHNKLPAIYKGFSTNAVPLRAGGTRRVMDAVTPHLLRMPSKEANGMMTKKKNSSVPESTTPTAQVSGGLSIKRRKKLDSISAMLDRINTPDNDNGGDVQQQPADEIIEVEMAETSEPSMPLERYSDDFNEAQFKLVYEALMTRHQFQQFSFPPFESDLYPASRSNILFVKTKEPESGWRPPKNQSMLTLDCEMCKTKIGLEVTRLSVLDMAGAVVYESFVLPENPIQDYCTKYSGITEKDMESATATLLDVQVRLLELITAKTILIGHSLENDLQCLRLIHDKIIDTSVLFPHPGGANYKHKLRYLAKKFLNLDIQNGQDGHDSAIDARCCMDLVKLYLVKGRSILESESTTSIFEVLHENDVECSVICSPETVPYASDTSVDIAAVTSDDEAVDQFVKVMSKPEESRPKFVFVQFSSILEINKNEIEQSAAIPRLNSNCERLFSNITPSSLVIVLLGEGNTVPIDKVMHGRRMFELNDTEVQTVEDIVDNAKNCLLYVDSVPLRGLMRPDNVQ